MDARISRGGRVDREAANLQHSLMLALEVASPGQVSDILWAARNAMKYEESKRGNGRSLTAEEVVRGIHRESALVNSPPSPGRPSKVDVWLNQLQTAHSDAMRERFADAKPLERVLAAAKADLSRTSFWRLRKRAAVAGLLDM